MQEAAGNIQADKQQLRMEELERLFTVRQRRAAGVGHALLRMSNLGPGPTCWAGLHCLAVSFPAWITQLLKCCLLELRIPNLFLAAAGPRAAGAQGA